MKTVSLKSFLITGGSILICLIAFGGINSDLKAVLVSELSNFDLQGLYAAAAIVVAGAGIYVFANRTREEKRGNEIVNYSYHPPMHHRAVIKKTA